MFHDLKPANSQLRSIFKHCRAVNMNDAISRLLRSAVVASEKSISNGRPDTRGLRESSPSGVPGCSMRRAGIKSQECAGIQIQPEYIMPSIKAPPLLLPLHPWTGLSDGDRRGSGCPRAPASRPPLLQPPLSTLCQSASLQVAENTAMEGRMCAV